MPNGNEALATGAVSKGTASRLAVSQSARKAGYAPKSGRKVSKSPMKGKSFVYGSVGEHKKLNAGIHGEKNYSVKRSMKRARAALKAG